jgi:hypothetical protein
LLPPSAQFSQLDLEHLAELTGLTSLTYGVNFEQCHAIGTIAQLTGLRCLRLQSPPRFDDAQLRQLSMLSRLSSLELSGVDCFSLLSHRVSDVLQTL